MKQPTRKQRPRPADFGAHDVGEGRELERIIFFSDAVFAIVVTLLVLDIRVPEIPPSLVAQQLPAALAALWPNIFSFVVSFILIGLYFWQMHHSTFRTILKYDDRLLFINVLLLMGVAFLPFSVSLVSEYGNQRIAAAIYLGNMAGVGLLLAGLFWYALRRKLVDPALDARAPRRMLAGLLALPLTCLLGLFLSLWAPSVWWLVFLLVRPLELVLIGLFAARQRKEQVPSR